MANVKDVVKGFITVDEVSKLKRDDVIKLQSEYQNQVRLQMALGLGAAQQFVGANENGIELIDSDGNNHLDMIGGVGVMTVGTANQYIWKAIEKFKDIPAINAIAVRAVSAALSSNIAALSGGGLKKVWIGTGGTEANEGAIKLARMSFKGQRHKFVALDGSYHGKTMGSVSITGRKIWQLYHSPVLPGVEFVAINDIDALDNALKFGDVAAFFIEPIQGEGGIHIATIEYLQKARELCTKYGTLMVCDEIQCGMARTGKFWAYQYADITPDVVTFAKGFSGGYIPIGGYITTEKVWNAAYGEPQTAFQHTATFGDNVLGCAAAIASLE
ncbi:MAG: aminotransferase class III-fold pyridoxal phosphate-dependent enzyme, partial [Bacillota bacterium]